MTLEGRGTLLTGDDERKTEPRPQPQLDRHKWLSDDVE